MMQLQGDPRGWAQHTVPDFTARSARNGRRSGLGSLDEPVNRKTKTHVRVEKLRAILDQHRHRGSCRVGRLGIGEAEFVSDLGELPPESFLGL
jgi:hypothetical protein